MSRDARPSRFPLTLFVITMIVMPGWTGCARRSQPSVERRSSFDAQPRFSPAPESSEVTPHPNVEPQRVEIGRSVGGRSIQAEIFGQGDMTVLIIASIHGDESAGTPLVRQLSDHLARRPELLTGRRVILVPVANPDGTATDHRTNLRGVDLNRNFPASNHTSGGSHGPAPLSEPESRALCSVLQKYSPDRVISIHQPLNCIDYDGPGDRLARAMATSSSLPLKRIGSLPGSLGSFAGINRQTPIVTVEFPRSADHLSAGELWDRYGRMLLVGICHPDMPPLDTAVTDRPVPPAGSNAGALGN